MQSVMLIKLRQAFESRLQHQSSNTTDEHQNRFSNQPEIYKQFLEILQTYQRESKPIQDVYAQVTQLFNSAPDLLEDFKQFLPESAAQAKAQAAAKQVNEEAAMLSNVRSEYSQHAQVQTPRPEMKMPPVGNFAPPSATKENKKRRGGPGSQMTGGAAAIDSGVGPSGSNRNGAGRGNTNKVSYYCCPNFLLLSKTPTFLSLPSPTTNFTSSNIVWNTADHHATCESSIPFYSLAPVSY